MLHLLPGLLFHVWRAVRVAVWVVVWIVFCAVLWLVVWVIVCCLIYCLILFFCLFCQNFLILFLVALDCCCLPYGERSFDFNRLKWIVFYLFLVLLFDVWRVVYDVVWLWTAFLTCCLGSCLTCFLRYCLLFESLLELLSG